MNHSLRTWSLLGACLLAASLFVGCKTADNEYVEPPPPEVTVAKPLFEPVVRFVEKTGTTEAAERADVRARVQGFVEQIEFEPGQEVQKDALLYAIEKARYEARAEAAQASLAAAQAAVTVADASVETAKAEVFKAGQDLDRQNRLKEQNATSQSEYDQALAANEIATAQESAATAAVVAAKADVGEAEAALKDAELNLGYTDVHAPITGEITKTNIKLGNYVEEGAVLATVVDDRKIFANFTVSDLELLRLHADVEKTSPEPAKQDSRFWSSIKVLIRRETDSDYRFVGHIDYVDSEGIDAETGTFGLRAVFDNAERLLIPGLFVHVRVPSQKAVQQVLVPELATARNNQGTFVMVVGEDQKVEQRMVVTTTGIDGWAVIESGVSQDEWVVVEGLQRARPGLAVSPLKTELSAEGSRFIGAEAVKSLVPSEDAADR